MAQTVQIVPTWSFPYIHVVINDNSTVESDEVESSGDPTIKQCYVFMSSKGIDNKFVKRGSRKSAVNTFGDSNWKKYGQPLLQALDAANQVDSVVYMMRVMPENATYSNSFINTYYHADTEDEVPDAHLRKFRIKNVFESKELMYTQDDMDSILSSTEPDDLGDDFNGKRLAYISSIGRGTYGDCYSLRVSPNVTYEKDYGIKMYTFEVLSSEKGLEKVATYVGGITTSPKYGSENITFINDILDNVSDGLAPMIVKFNEDNVEEIYEEYIKFINQLQIDLVDEYDTKVADAADEDELAAIEEMINLLSDPDNIPDLDTFDLIFGTTLGDNGTMPAFTILKELTSTVDQDADDFDENEYFESTPLVSSSDEPVQYAKSNAVNFSSLKGIPVAFGSNGYFDSPRVELREDDTEVQWTLDDEIELCYNNGFNGTYDDAILSKNRIPIDFFCDANYPDSTKEIIYNLIETRNSCPGYFDGGVIESLGTSNIRSLKDRFAYMDNRIASCEIQSYLIREYNTQKKRRVTTTYFLATHLPDHIRIYGEHVPFTYEYAQLDGISDSVLPLISDYNQDIKELLYNNRFNYYECVAEDIFQRGCQNTRQSDNSDLLEENNIRTMYTFKKYIEADLRGELYNFADEGIRKRFIRYINEKYVNWNGSKFESYTFDIKTSKYEFNHSILHGYLGITFRGLNKQIICEVDINRRNYIDQTEDSEE